MTEPIYAQRYRTRRHLPAGRAEAAYAGKDAEGHPVVVTVVRPVDPDVFLRTMGVVAVGAPPRPRARRGRRARRRRLLRRALGLR